MLRKFSLVMCILVSLLLVIAVLPVAASHSLTLSNGRACLDGAEFTGEAIAVTALNLEMVGEVYDGPGSVLATGTRHTFTAIGETANFTVEYSVGSVAVGQTVLLSITDIPGQESGDEGDERFTTVQDCLLDDEEGEPQVTFFDPGDARINRHAYALAAIYCNADHILITGIAPGAGSINVANDDLPETPTGTNVLVAESGNIRFFRLVTGEWQVIAGPDGEGKSYVATWDACPPTYLVAGVLQGGVFTPTETNTF